MDFEIISPPECKEAWPVSTTEEVDVYIKRLKQRLIAGWSPQKVISSRVHTYLAQKRFRYAQGAASLIARQYRCYRGNYRMRASVALEKFFHGAASRRHLRVLRRLTDARQMLATAEAEKTALAKKLATSQAKLEMCSDVEQQKLHLDVELRQQVDQNKILQLEAKLCTPARFTIKNMKSNRFLNVLHGEDADGAKVQQWSNPDSSHSHWCIVKSKLHAQALPRILVHIVCLANGRALRAGSVIRGLNLSMGSKLLYPDGHIVEPPRTTTSILTWELVYCGNDHIKIKPFIVPGAIENPYALNLSGGSCALGANIQLWDKSTARDSFWQVQYVDKQFQPLKF